MEELKVAWMEIMLIMWDLNEKEEDDTLTLDLCYACGCPNKGNLTANVEANLRFVCNKIKCPDGQKKT